ncbi:MAG TPA: SPW repeat protein [Chthoniobacterales bacterium]
MNAETTGTESASAPVWTSGINIVAGIWLIIAPFVLVYASEAARVNDIVLGAVIGVFALIRTLTPNSGTAWLSRLNAIFGIWLIIAPFVLAYERATARTNDIILGIIVLILALWSSAMSPTMTTARVR